MTGPSVQHGTFTVERAFAFPPERVFAAFADPKAKAAWFSGPAGKWKALIREMDFKVGGRERVRGEFEGGYVSDFRAHYFDIVPDRRIVYTYDMYVNDTKISVSLATLQFLLAPAGTKLLVTEQGAFLDGYDDAGGRENGTKMLVENVAAFLEGRTDKQWCR